MCAGDGRCRSWRSAEASRLAVASRTKPPPLRSLRCAV